MEILVDRFTASLDAVRSAANFLPVDVGTVKALDDEALLASQRLLADARCAVDACASLIAGEIGHRSRRDLGYSGLAQREGFRTPEALVQHTTGSTAKDASTLVHVGAMVHDALNEQQRGGGASAGEDCVVREVWLRAVGIAVGTGGLSVEAAKAIQSGLGEPAMDAAGRGVTVDDLTRAAQTLLREAADLNVDRLFRRARELRDDLDEAGIADRERAIHQQRSMRRVRRPNGLSRYIFDPDLEASAFWDDVYDTLTSPRRGGPRFSDPAGQAWAEAIAADERTTEQYAHDAFTELLRIGVTADTTDSRIIIGSRIPAVRVLVSADALTNRTGHGRIEGCDIPVSIDTVERIACTTGTVPIVFDDNGQTVNLGREQRLFSSRQRIALAARDGGCRWPGCDRPPRWTEAHHVQHWRRDGGRTDLADGILLCRHHHLLLHDNHWEIRRQDSDYRLIPPPTIDRQQMPRPMPSKSAALRDLHALRDLQQGSTRRTPPAAAAG